MRDGSGHATAGVAPWGPAAVVVAWLAGWLLLHGQTDAWETLSNGALVLTGPVLAFLAWRAGRAWPKGSRRRAGLWLLGLGLMLNGLGEAVWFWYESVLGEDPWFSLADLLYLSTYPVLLIGMTVLHGGLGTWSRRLGLLTDLAIAVLGFAMLSWAYAIHPTLALGAESPAEMALALAYPLAGLTLVAGTSALVLGRTAGVLSPAMRALATSFVLIFLADVGWTLTTLKDTYASGGLIDGVYVLAAGIQAWAFLRARRAGAPTSGADREPEDVRPAVPLVGGLLGYGALLHSSFGTDGAAVPGLIVGATLLTVLLLIRQRGLVQENLRLLTERLARASEERFAALIRHSSDLTLIADEGGRITWASPSSRAVAGCPPDALLGRTLDELLGPTAAAPGTDNRQVFELRTEETVRPVEVVVTDMRQDPTVRGRVLNVRDVSERRALEERLAWQAEHDALTGLPNRVALHKRLRVLAQQGRGGLLLIDLDGFKHVNDSMGHAAGDRLLREIGARLTALGPPSAFVCRLGGDEFAVVVEASQEEDTTRQEAERVLRAIAAPLELQGRRVDLSASVGFAQAGPLLGPSELLRNADLAMYAAKHQGRSRACAFTEVLHERAQARMEMITDLAEALRQGAITPHFQAVTELGTGRVRGVEALARWHHPTRGMVSPADFIPLAEESGLIVELGMQVLRQALQVARGWPEDDRRSPYLAVNLSPRQLRDEALVRNLLATLVETGFPPQRLVLEVTETWLMEDLGEARRRLEQIRALGVRIALDDFGTGHSSLALLADLPLDQLKIARPFVERLRGPQPDPALVSAIVGIARSLRLDMVAEGVEDEAQRRALLEEGCALGQGFLLHRPGPPERLPAALCPPRVRAEADRALELAP